MILQIRLRDHNVKYPRNISVDLHRKHGRPARRHERACSSSDADARGSGPLAGRRRVLGEDHPSTQDAIAVMNMIEENLLTEEVGEAEEEEEEEDEDEEEETMYQRLAKRHRRA